MDSKAKRPVKRKAIAKKAARRKIAGRQGVGIKSVRKAARAVVQSASQKSAAVKKAGKGLVRRAVKAVTGTVVPLLPGSTSGKPKST